MTNSKIPNWFQWVAIILLVWNVLGLFSFLAHVFITDEMIAQFPENEQALYGEYPIWTHVLFAVGVFGGLLGSLSLLRKKKSALLFFQISFIAVIIQMSYNLFFTSSIEVYGALQALLMPVLVIVLAFYSVRLASKATKKNWIE